MARLRAGFQELAAGLAASKTAEDRAGAWDAYVGHHKDEIAADTQAASEVLESGSLKDLVAFADGFVDDLAASRASAIAAGESATPAVK